MGLFNLKEFTTYFRLKVMALAFTQEPSKVIATIQPYCVTMYNSSYGSYTKYRYVLDISVNDVLVDRKKLLPNASGYGIFDISRTLQDYLTSQKLNQSTAAEAVPQNISELSDNTDFTNSTTFSKSTSVIFVKLEAREEYDIAGTVTLSSVQDTNQCYAFPFAVQFADGANYFDSTLLPSDVANTKRPLTNAPSIVYCPADGYGTLAFINAFTGTDTANQIKTITYQGYNSSFSIVSADVVTFDLTTALDGIQVGLDLDNPSNFGVTVKNNVICYVPFGWQNIDNDASLTGQFPSSSYIKIFFTATDGDVMESPFLGVTDCSRFPNVRIRFKNAFGVWDYFDFNKVSKKSESIDKKSFKRIIGNFSGTSYSYNTYDRETKQYGFSGVQSMILNTNWLDEDTYTWLSELIESNEVAIYEGGNWIAVNVTDNNYEFKTDVVDGIKKQLTIKCEYANSLRLAQ